MVLPAGYVGWGDQDARGTTYSQAARALLAYRHAGTDAARDFLDSLNSTSD
ncbi:hypothetical protein [Actinophytocola sp.]|uniref:hypothetical protein n=1 Tax=Actinophytocola sp. TaxID=1872138 RepID=UPI0025B8F83E|nr:hypothetical protein [Actinophytocola sp.]